MRSLFPFKIQAADSFDVILKEGYNGGLASKQAGSIGGQIRRI
ncbi:MAG: small, acid-soluble spore protein, alpha/beta type [Clostridia bacterium]|nr:small, acid-soluble spore protein, alpha/beta type [Clostridia bacterium]